MSISRPRKRTVLVLLATVALSIPVLTDRSSGLTSTFSGTVSATGTSSRSHTFLVTQTGPIVATLSWPTSSTNLNLFLFSPNGSLVASRTTTQRPERLTFTANVTGSWRLRVTASRGSASYTLTVQHSTSSTSTTSISPTSSTSTSTSSSTSTSTSTTTTTTTGPPPSDRPNIVLILTDDQRADSVWAMPTVVSQLQGRGVTFTNGFVVDPLCCPSRASILKGAYAHTTRVYHNGVGANAPFPDFNPTSTVATWLDASGYETGLFGKYFNGYDQSRAEQVPPGWDRWVAFATSDVGGGMYYNYGLSVDGALVTRGSTSADYSTDVLSNYVTTFIRNTPADRPLFVDFTPYAPHQPSTPAPRHSTAFSGLAPWRPPNYNEADVSDKPAYIRNLPPIGAFTQSVLDAERRRMLQSLLAVDDAIAAILDALADTNRLQNTLIVFMGDNGFLHGEHRWGQTGAQNKQVPYEESIRVPFVVRYDPLTSTPRTDDRFVLNIDLAPTFAALAGASAPGVEGQSLLPVLDQTAATWRNDFLIENFLTAVPSYCAVRSPGQIYTQYSTGEEELYDLVTDPHELVNRASDPAMAPTIDAMRARVRELCSPPPPFMSLR